MDEKTQEIAFSKANEQHLKDCRNHLESLNVVSSDKNAIWLIDYWCGKDIRGLIQMPFSRHWIMHIEACLRIKKKLTGR